MTVKTVTATNKRMKFASFRINPRAGDQKLIPAKKINANNMATIPLTVKQELIKFSGSFDAGKNLINPTSNPSLENTANKPAADTMAEKRPISAAV